MDINCGTIVDGKETIQQVGRALLRADPRDRVRAGRPSREEFGYGEDEFAPWVLGATM